MQESLVRRRRRRVRPSGDFDRLRCPADFALAEELPTGLSLDQDLSRGSFSRTDRPRSMEPTALPLRWRLSFSSVGRSLALPKPRPKKSKADQVRRNTLLSEHVPPLQKFRGINTCVFRAGSFCDRALFLLHWGCHCEASFELPRPNLAKPTTPWSLANSDCKLPLVPSASSGFATIT